MTATNMCQISVVNGPVFDMVNLYLDMAIYLVTKQEWVNSSHQFVNVIEQCI